jgi:hypothetical protein
MALIQAYALEAFELVLLTSKGFLVRTLSILALLKIGNNDKFFDNRIKGKGEGRKGSANPLFPFRT